MSTTSCDAQRGARNRGPNIALAGSAAILGALMLSGALAYAGQYTRGLGVTGLSRDVPWGLYIGQFTFLVGIAASAVMVVLPSALWGDRELGKVVPLGELTSVVALVMALLFVAVDVGQPLRALNILLYPAPQSLMFWDFLVVFGYLGINAVLFSAGLGAKRRRRPAARWTRGLALLSIPWAFTIHTVTAMLYSGLAARPGWMTALLAPRFLASAFASGPALLLILTLLSRRLGVFDAGAKAVTRLSHIIAVATALHLFFGALEAFTALYSGLPATGEHFRHLYGERAASHSPAPWLWTALPLACVSLTALALPSERWRSPRFLLGSSGVLAAVWIEKGLWLIPSGFTPSALGDPAAYFPSAPEFAIAAGIYASGVLVFLGTASLASASAMTPQLPP